VESDYNDRVDTVSAPLASGTVLGGTYRVLRQIGAGAMGEIYAATHTRLAGHYAVGDRRVHRLQRRRILVHHLVDHRRRAVAVKGLAPGQQLVGDCRQRELVRARIDLLVLPSACSGDM
jgi:hypothetical protein